MSDDKSALLAAHDEALRKSRERLLRVQLKQMKEAVDRARTILHGVEGMIESLQDDDWGEA